MAGPPTAPAPRANPLTRRLRARIAPLGILSRGLVVILTLISLAAGAAEAALLVLMVQLAFRVSDQDPGGSWISNLDLGLSWLFVTALGVATIRLVLHFYASRLSARASTDTVTDLRHEIFGEFEQASWDRQSQARTGELQELIQSNAKAAGSMAIAASALVIAVVNFVALVGSSFVIDALGSLVLVFIALVLMLVLRPVSQRTRRYSEEWSSRNLLYAQQLQESLGMAVEMKVFDTGRRVAQRLDEAQLTTARPYYRLMFVGRMYPAVYQTLAFVLIIAGLAALSAVNVGSVSSLGAVILLLIRSISYSQAAQVAGQQLDAVIPTVDQARAAIEDFRSRRQVGGGEPLDRLTSIALDGVSYVYPGDRQALVDVSLSIAQGEMVAVIGPSGAGKSTLVQILLRLREPTSGRFLVNGDDARGFSLGSWFGRIAYVPQDSRLTSDSVADNIRWLRDEIDDEAVQAAARLAHIHDDVLSWPQGYATTVGQAGAEVSGGQRQRICLARAFAGQPDLLILDEPTSALDAGSTALVRQTLDEIRGRMTVVVISHDRAVADVCDRVVVLDHGRVAAEPVV